MASTETSQEIGSAPRIVMIPIGQLREGASNARRQFDEASLAELTASIRHHGVLMPLIARRIGFGIHEADASTEYYELVTGARRLRAATAAGLTEVPVVVRQCDGLAARDTALVENLQRQDITPLEEARAFEALTASQAGLDGAHAVARRIGKDARYVWERMRLLALIPDAQDLLDECRITVTHAIALSRLTPEQQATAIDPEPAHTNRGGLFEVMSQLAFTDRDDDATNRKQDPYAGMKAVSVREFEAWVAKHIRFDVTQAAAAAPLDFGPVAEQVQTAAAQPGRGKKVVPISHDYQLHADARADERTYCVNAWKRADGQEKSSTCDKSVLGVIVAGPGYGEAFDVCVNRDCDVHWAKERKAREKAAASRSGGGSSLKNDKWDEQDRKNKERQVKEDAARKAFSAKKPDIIKALAVAIASKKPTALADLAMRQWSHAEERLAAKLLGVAKNADAIVRHVGFLLLVDDLHRWDAHATFQGIAKKAIGLDLAPLLTAEQEPKAKTPAKGKKR